MTPKELAARRRGVQPMRAGRRYWLDTLIERYGSAFGVPDLLRVLSADCPKRAGTNVYDLCGIRCPDLPALFGVSQPTE